MSISEKELEDYIFDDLTCEGNNLLNRGLRLNFNSLLEVHTPNIFNARWERQVNLDPYGIADIIGFYRYCGRIHVEILELKIREIKLEDFEQICRYRRAVERLVENTFPGRKLPIEYHLTLVGTSYDRFYLSNLLPIRVAEFQYDLDGIEFTLHGLRPSWFNRGDSNKSLKHFFYGEKVH